MAILIALAIGIAAVLAIPIHSSSGEHEIVLGRSAKFTGPSLPYSEHAAWRRWAEFAAATDTSHHGLTFSSILTTAFAGVPRTIATSRQKSILV